MDSTGGEAYQTQRPDLRSKDRHMASASTAHAHPHYKTG
jgi:hypothetical protein